MFIVANTTPDAALMTAAANNQLGTPDLVAAQAMRLLQSQTAYETVRDFHHQWLELDLLAAQRSGYVYERQGAELPAVRHQGEEGLALARQLRDSGRMSWKTPEAGIATGLYATTAPELSGKGDAYLVDCSIANISADGPDFRSVRPYAIDPDLAERLWRVSEQLVAQGDKR